MPGKFVLSINLPVEQPRNDVAIQLAAPRQLGLTTLYLCLRADDLIVPVAACSGAAYAQTPELARRLPADCSCSSLQAARRFRRELGVGTRGRGTKPRAAFDVDVSSSVYNLVMRP